MKDFLTEEETQEMFLTITKEIITQGNLDISNIEPNQFYQELNAVFIHFNVTTQRATEENFYTYYKNFFRKFNLHPDDKLLLLTSKFLLSLHSPRPTSKKQRRLYDKTIASINKYYKNNNK